LQHRDHIDRIDEGHARQIVLRPDHRRRHRAIGRDLDFHRLANPDRLVELEHRPGARDVADHAQPLILRG